MDIALMNERACCDPNSRSQGVIRFGLHHAKALSSVWPYLMRFFYSVEGFSRVGLDILKNKNALLFLRITSATMTVPRDFLSKDRVTLPNG